MVRIVGRRASRTGKRMPVDQRGGGQVDPAGFEGYRIPVGPASCVDKLRQLTRI